MLFRVLGPLEVESENGRLTLGGARQRAVLATLVLQANEVVSRDRLIEAVWGENPPDTAASALQGYISSLRKTVGADFIVTRAPGYALETAPEQVDLRRFEALASAGADALAAGDASRAAELLSQALTLWRGEPLADLNSVEFVQSERLRLEELRLGARADRIDADLELGRHAELVGELRSLVREHPVRERFRAQLMLALYRSGRQAEALDVYQQGRRLFASELGIEPGEQLRRLERAILQQDEALAPPTAAARRRASPQHRGPAWPPPRRRSTVAALAVGALVGSVVLAVVLTRSAASAPIVRANSIAVVDTAANRVVGDIPIDGNPVAIAAGPSGVYVASEQEGIVWRIDPTTRKIVKRLGVGADVHDLAVGFGSVWLADGTDGTVTRVDDHLHEIGPRIPVGRPAFWIGTGAGGVWVTSGDSVVEIDPATNRIIPSSRVPIPNPTGLAVGLRGVWVASGRGVIRVEPGTSRTSSPSGELPAPALAPAVGKGGVWSIVYNDLGEIWRISPSEEVVSRVGRYPLDIAVGDDAVWTIDTRGMVTGFEPANTGRKIRIPTAPTIRSALATTKGLLWAAIERPS